jgi:hypothetical protein
MEKQTAVEWYNEQLNVYGDMVFNKEITLGQYHIKKQELLEQAKEMEKQEIIKAAARGYLAMPERFNLEEAKDYGEQYYDNICGGKENE